MNSSGNSWFKGTARQTRPHWPVIGHFFPYYTHIGPLAVSRPFHTSCRFPWRRLHSVSSYNPCQTPTLSPGSDTTYSRKSLQDPPLMPLLSSNQKDLHLPRGSPDTQHGTALTSARWILFSPLLTCEVPKPRTGSLRPRAYGLHGPWKEFKTWL